MEKAAEADAPEFAEKVESRSVGWLHRVEAPIICEFSVSLREFGSWHLAELFLR